MSDLAEVAGSESKSDLSGLSEPKKTELIRSYLQSLVDRGELDLFRSVPNVKLRQWAQDLKARYGRDFNVNTISTVLRELRIANSYKLDRELVESAPKAPSESKPEAVKPESAAMSAPESSESESKAPESGSSGEGGSGGDVWPGIILVAGLGALVALGLIGSYYLSQNK